jgi:phage virion morphogenesis protein
MSGAFVKIDIEGQERVEAALSGLARRAANLRPVLDDIGEYLMLAHEERFDAQESPAGEPWAPLSERYRARKKRNRDKILVLDDVLAGTLRYQAGADSLLFGTDRVYGATHQFGREADGIPARPFLGTSAADEDEILRLIAEHLEGGI